MSSKKKRATWSSRTTFILAAVGSAVGLGNAWRFPGLIAANGGGAFLFVYLIGMLVVGVPLLMMEISIGRKMKKGAPLAMRGINKKAEWIGWAATTNAFVIATYYAAVFAWVLIMMVLSYKFSGMTGTETGISEAQSLWASTIQTTGTFSGFGTVALPVVIALLIAWAAIYFCIRRGAHSVSKVVKYTVFIPVAVLVIMAIKGFTMPNSGAAMAALFIPDFSYLTSASLWVDAIGQVFFSLSIMMAIMFAYGSFLDDESNIAVDALIIAFSDMAISVLAGIVLFTTMYGIGMTTADMSSSGIGTAFIIYPTAIVNLTGSGTFNAVFGFLFYFCLATLAIDSAFSIVEGVSTAVADKFKLSHNKTTIGICAVSGVLSLTFATGAGLAMLDVIDRWTNNYTMILIGILECIAVGWFFNTKKVLNEINRNTTGFKMPEWWFMTSVKYVIPAALAILFGWNVVSLFIGDGIYGAADGYTLSSNIIFGWCFMALALVSGFIINAVYKARVKKDPARYADDDNEFVWED